MAKAPDAREKEEAGEEKPRKKSKLPLVIGLVVLLAAAGGGGYFFLQGKSEQAPEQKPVAAKAPIFVALEPFTVNLSSDEGEQYLQVAATLKVLDPSAVDAIKLHMPEVRHRMLTLLASKKPSQISSGEGRERLAEEMRQTAGNILLAAAGKPIKPIVLEEPASAEPADATASGEETTEQDENAVTARPAKVLAKAAADDPVQSVFFTSFIIQ